MTKSPIRENRYQRPVVGAKLTQLPSVCFDDLFDRLKKCTPTLENALNAATTNEERFRLVWTNARVQSTLTEYVDLFASAKRQFGLMNPSSGQVKAVLQLSPHKDVQTAALLRLTANDLYSKGNFDSAFCLYNTALRMAPLPMGDSENVEIGTEASLLFANRSAAYLANKQYISSLVDIDAALALGYATRGTPAQQWKLLSRKVECLKALGCLTEEGKIGLLEDLETLAKETAGTDMEIRVKDLLKLVTTLAATATKVSRSEPDEPSRVLASIREDFRSKKLLSPNRQLLSLSSKLEVRSDPVKGRGLFAREDVALGEALSVSLPLVQVLQDGEEWNACHHCARRLRPLEDSKSKYLLAHQLPCWRCSEVLFCGVSCRSKAWNAYHRFECGFNPMLRQKPLLQLALRVLHQTGLEHIRKVIRQEEEEKDQGEEDKPVELSDSEDYLQIYRLEHHQDKLSTRDLAILGLLPACLLMKCALLNGFLPKDAPPGDIDFVGGLLSRTCLQVLVNHRTIHQCTADLDSFNVSQMATPVIGFALYGASSLLNHACQPNAFHATWFRPDIELSTVEVIQAKRPIAAGEEVTIWYGVPPVRFNPNLEDRRQLIKKAYHFRCHCLICIRDERDNPHPGENYYPPVCGHNMTCRSVVEKVVITGGSQKQKKKEYKCFHAKHPMFADKFRKKVTQIRTLVHEAELLEDRIEQHLNRKKVIPRALLDSFHHLIAVELYELVYLPAFELPVQYYTNRLATYTTQIDRPYRLPEIFQIIKWFCTLLDDIYGQNSFEAYRHRTVHLADFSKIIATYLTKIADRSGIKMGEDNAEEQEELEEGKAMLVIALKHNEQLRDKLSIKAFEGTKV